MGPRKQLASHSKCPRSPIQRAVGSERRSKARHDPIPSTQAPAQPSPSPAAERMAGRVIVGGRKVNFQYFDTHGFSLGQWIRLAGCEGFCTMKERYYPLLVQEFYGSLGRGSEGWVATVRGVTFGVTDEVLGRIWGIPRLGPISDTLADREAGFRCILEREDVRGVTSVTAVQLSVEMRLLHHIVARIFLPKTGHFDYITERELTVMVSLVRGLVLNIPGLMLRQMQEASTSKRLCLPYGMALTRVFREFGVPLDDQVYRELQHADTYDDRSLHRMGYRLVGGRWTRRISGQIADSDSEEEQLRAAEAGPSGATAHIGTEEGEPSTPPTTRPPQPPPAAPQQPWDDHAIDRIVAAVTRSIRDEIAALRTETHTSLDQLRTELGTLRSESQTALDALRSEMQTGFAAILAAVQGSPPASAPPAPDSSTDTSSDSPPPSPPAPPTDPISSHTSTEILSDHTVSGQPSGQTDQDLHDAQGPAPAAVTEAPLPVPDPRSTLPRQTTRALGFYTPGFRSGPSSRTRSSTYRTPRTSLSRVTAPIFIDFPSDEE